MKLPVSTQPPADRVALTEAMAQAMQHAAIDALVHADQRAAQAPLMVQPGLTPIAPTRLASHLSDVGAREQARQLYERCLVRYREQARARLGEQPSPAHRRLDDAGTALTRFVAVSMQALHGVHATPAMLRRLGSQLTTVAYASSAWDAASLADRQAYFEQMAILSVLIEELSAQAATQGAAAIANVRRAARGYLQQLLGFDPDRVTLGANGLVPRAA